MSMTFYIAVLTTSETGGWRVLFPDVPECEAKAVSLDDGKFVAVEALQRYANGARAKLRPPRDLIAIERDVDWLERSRVDLSKAIVTMVPLPD